MVAWDRVSRADVLRAIGCTQSGVGIERTKTNGAAWGNAPAKARKSMSSCRSPRLRSQPLCRQYLSIPPSNAPRNLETGQQHHRTE